MPQLWNQYRSVVIGGNDFSEFDVDIEVTKPESDPLEFDVTIYNVADSTWSNVSTGDVVVIELGWNDGPSETVCVGTIDSMPGREREKSDLAYSVQGVDETEKVLKQTPESGDNWGRKPVVQIASDIIEKAGLSPVVDDAPARTSKVWSITTDQSYSAQLDELRELANELTGVKWEFFGERGQGYFLKKETSTTSVPKFSYDGLLLSASETSGANDDDESEKVEIKAMLDPRIRKGAKVVVDAGRFDGAYIVEKYSYSSNSDQGEHTVTATVAPVDTDYTIES